MGVKTYSKEILGAQHFGRKRPEKIWPLPPLEKYYPFKNTFIGENQRVYYKPHT